MVSFSEQKFNSPEEEIKWVKKYIEEKKQPEHAPGQSEYAAKEITKEALKEIEKLPEESTGAYRLTPQEVAEKTHALSKEPHHNQTDELMNIVKEKGLMSALKVARSLHNDHFVDDFHDRLAAERLEGDSSITPPSP